MRAFGIFFKLHRPWNANWFHDVRDIDIVGNKMYERCRDIALSIRTLHVTHKIVPEMTYNVSIGMLNHTIPHQE